MVRMRLMNVSREKGDGENDVLILLNMIILF